MSPGKQYRLNSATLGLTEVGRHRVALQIPANAIVTLTGCFVDDSKFVQVAWEDKTLALFASDMRERGIPLRSAGKNQGYAGALRQFG
jgi:hypothetical protein